MEPDVLVAGCATPNTPCPGNSTVSVLLGNGDGTFQDVVTYDAGGYGTSAIAVADVNGDGKPDLLLANECASYAACANGTVTVLLGNGDGTFQTPISFNSGGTDATSIAVADVNGDGKPDLLAANYCIATCTGGLASDGSVAVLLGNGDGTFQAAVAYDSGGQNTYSLAVANLGGNGKFDVAVVSCASSAGVPVCGEFNGVVSILLGNGDGTFQTAVPYDTGGGFSNSLAIADLNGDGKLDIVVSDACQGGLNCSTDGAASVLLGNGDGTFQNAVLYDSGYETEAIGVSDINGDGKPDIAVASHCTTLGGDCPTSLIGVLPGNGDGTFQPATFFGSGGSPALSFDIADVNQDRKPDVLVANLQAQGVISPIVPAVGVLINTTILGPAASPNPASLSFANQTAGVASSSQAVTLTSTGSVNLTITTISFAGANAGDFAQTNNCASSLPPGASCQVNVTFTPMGGPYRAAALQFTDSALDSPQTVALSGSVQDFSLAATSQTSLTVAPGQVANYAIALSPINGFTGNVTLGCSGAPQQSTCNVNPSSVMVSSNGTSVNIAVATTGASAWLADPAAFPPTGRTKLAFWMGMSGLYGLALLGAGVQRSRGKHGPLFCGLTPLCLLLVVITWSACGGSSHSTGGGTPTGTYNLTVTGTFTKGSASLTNSQKLTLIVQ